MNEIQTNASGRWPRITSGADSALSRPSDGNSHKPRRDHRYREEVEGCRPADSHRASLDADLVKQDNVFVTILTNFRQGEAEVKEEVVTLTATIETNLRQGDLETEVDGTKVDLTETEMESNEALSEWEESNYGFLTRTRLWFAGASASQMISPRLF